ncbi:MAG: (2Fe-2S)-binding protein [Dehalococcoidia bacterium]|nr:(2Fe-2S)-binding protein [Dehalococcoidia bacterium]MCA9845849.1 (2Fe-2S)-binding protein [Dehalococcoidia bacterium]
MTARTINLNVNGEHKEWSVAENDLLLTELREREGLTGAKYGCGIGECGACTVLVDGQPSLSCLVLAQSVDGCDVLTIEGLARGGELDPLQIAFLDQAAVQCGFCTPGMVLMGRALLNEIPDPTEKDVREFLKGNLCRCTGYSSIVRAILTHRR